MAGRPPLSSPPAPRRRAGSRKCRSPYRSALSCLRFPFPSAPPAGRALLFARVRGEVAKLVARRVQRALGLVLGAAFLHVADQAGQPLLLLGDVEPVDRL